VRVSDATVAGRADVSNLNFGIDQPAVAVDPAETRRLLLSSPFPNPFTDRVAVELDLPAEADVVAEVCDLLGRRVASLLDRRLQAGRHRLMWDTAAGSGPDEPAGLYFLRVRSPGFEAMRRIVRVR
jgi:hypothetical protein